MRPINSDAGLSHSVKHSPYECTSLGGDVGDYGASWRAPIELLAIIGSYGDTMNDAEVLEALQAYNRGEAIMEVDLDAREIEAGRATDAFPGQKRGRRKSS